MRDDDLGGDVHPGPGYLVGAIGHSRRVKVLMAEYDVPYTTGPLIRQFCHIARTICKLALPDGFLTATSHDAPETASEKKFRTAATTPRIVPDHVVGTRRRGLVAAIADGGASQSTKNWRRPIIAKVAALVALRVF